MANRRGFIKNSLLTAFALSWAGKMTHAAGLSSLRADPQESASFPVILSTWNHGLAANEAAYRQMQQGHTVLDAVEQGVRVSEADPKVSSVGYGGLPDASGEVSLDACIMGPDGKAGSVSCLKHIMHPISVARLVMEITPHVMLSGSGALDFALQQGFKKEKLLTASAAEAWQQWKQSGARYAPKANWENHDTIGLIAIDANGMIGGACTTSGMAFKHPGRVGDSPIIGAGLYVDNAVGAATATGEGEAIMQTLGSFLVVELMRNGYSPEQACKTAVERTAASQYMHPQLQIGYIALNKHGASGGYALRPGFQYTLHQDKMNQLKDVPFLMDWE